jgi:hypothetical protein
MASSVSANRGRMSMVQWSDLLQKELMVAFSMLPLEMEMQKELTKFARVLAVEINRMRLQQTGTRAARQVMHLLLDAG